MTDTNDTIDLFDHYVVPSYARQPIVFVRGKGSKLWDSTGKVYLDFLAGISVLNVGHSHPVVTEAIARQAAQRTHGSNICFTENQGKLAKALSDLALHGKCFFAIPAPKPMRLSSSWRAYGDTIANAMKSLLCVTHSTDALWPR